MCVRSTNKRLCLWGPPERRSAPGSGRKYHNPGPGGRKLTQQHQPSFCSGTACLGREVWGGRTNTAPHQPGTLKINSLARHSRLLCWLKDLVLKFLCYDSVARVVVSYILAVGALPDLLHRMDLFTVLYMTNYSYIASPTGSSWFFLQEYKMSDCLALLHFTILGLLLQSKLTTNFSFKTLTVLHFLSLISDH